MSIDAIVDHAAEARTRLLQQFKDRPNITALINIMGDQAQLIENALLAQYDACLLDHAQGAQLTGVGAIVGQARGSMPDVLYRLFVLGKIGTNSSHATQEQLTQLVLTLFKAKSVAIRDAFTPGHAALQAPMAVGIEIGSPGIPAQYYDTALSLIRQALAGGVLLSWVSIFPDDAFAFDAQTQGEGFASDDGSTPGGALAAQLFTSTY